MLRASDLDWLYVSPAGDFDHDGDRTGRYQVAASADPEARVSYADFAIALADEASSPRNRRKHLLITSG
ncbi:hypothetical protein [Amycolatopsis methanolica]|uniref:hypothetical protein n=1 Tax=Amycolatopsis methanolica TaxID=1814 RepID=UPI00039FB39F|nr:hypothetical protein [Amycolatopsis methanolica]